MFKKVLRWLVVPAVSAALTGCQTSAPTLQQSTDVTSMAGDFDTPHPDDIRVLPTLRDGKRRLQAIPVSEVDPARSLLVRNLRVVNDPVRTAAGGAWHFGTLIKRMCGTHNPSTFTTEWLNTWKTEQTIKGHTIAARAAIDSLVITPWLRASGGAVLNLDRAPFRLLAIVNRVDLRTAGNYGEGRFIYGVLDGSGNPTPFTVILEYGIPSSLAPDLKTWATRWQNLANLPVGTENYNRALQTITDSFTMAGANPNKPNGSALNQLRTNEIALGSPWELREFRIAAQGRMRHRPTQQTPRQSLNNTQELATFINANESAILNDKHVVPPSMLGGSSLDLGPWTAPGVSEDVRAAFATATCIGCHTGETGTRFTHVTPRLRGAESTISTFLEMKLRSRAQDFASLL